MIIKSGTFTSSNPFTPSFTFSPNRTRVPDPPYYNGKAEVSGQSKIFSKEELKKAAAPASISVVFIIVAVVFSVIYINRRIKMLRNQPFDNFDLSFEEDEVVDSSSEYSYSYYTYTYTYASSSDDDYDEYYYSSTALDSSLETSSSQSQDDRPRSKKSHSKSNSSTLNNDQFHVDSNWPLNFEPTISTQQINPDFLSNNNSQISFNNVIPPGTSSQISISSQMQLNNSQTPIFPQSRIGSLNSIESQQVNPQTLVNSQSRANSLASIDESLPLLNSQSRTNLAAPNILYLAEASQSGQSDYGDNSLLSESSST